MSRLGLKFIQNRITIFFSDDHHLNEQKEKISFQCIYLFIYLFSISSVIVGCLQQKLQLKQIVAQTLLNSLEQLRALISVVSNTRKHVIKFTIKQHSN